MKQYLILPFLLLLSHIVTAQEFNTFENGLIYSETTIEQLAHIVDSLNLQHQTCEQFPSFQALPQGQGYSLSLELEEKERVALLQYLKTGPSLEAFKAKYSPEIGDQNYFVQYQYTNRIGQKVLSFENVNTKGWWSNSIDITENLAAYDNSSAVRWVYNAQHLLKRTSIDLIYLPKGLTTSTLAANYAQLVAYGDCLIDPTVKKMFPSNLSINNQGDSWYSLPKNWEQQSNNQKIALLDTLRSMHVVGYCSQDTRPREHALAIATVAAHTTQWPVFLRAHLDVLNDRFARRSDGNYAYGTRQTYLKELEVLNINVPDLLLGITLRVEHPKDHHYLGSIGRLGRAVVESKDRAAIAERLLFMIQDPQLDDFNRRIAANFYWSYLHYLPEEDASLEAGIASFRVAFATLPVYLQKGLSLERLIGK